MRDGMCDGRRLFYIPGGILWGGDWKNLGLQFCASWSVKKYGLGCTDVFDRHVITPPSFSAIFGFVVNFTQSFPVGETFIDRYMKFLIFSSPFAMHYRLAICVLAI